MHKVFKLNLTVSVKYYKIISITRQYHGFPSPDNIMAFHHQRVYVKYMKCIQFREAFV